MPNDTTNTLARIIQLEDEYVRRTSTAEWDDENRWRCIEIRRTLDAMWDKRRAELVFEQHGPPRMISAPDPRSQPQIRRFAHGAIAHGIPPLPSGGD